MENKLISSKSAKNLAELYIKAEQALALGRVFLKEGSGYKEADKAYL